MVRRALVEKTPEVVQGFRMRGTEVSRMEGFADGVLFCLLYPVIPLLSVAIALWAPKTMTAMAGWVTS